MTDLPLERDGSTVLLRLYESWNDRRAANQNEPIAFLRSLFREWEDVSTEPTDVTYETIDGTPHGLKAIPAGSRPSAALLYIHGGGYVGGSSSTHRKFAGHLAKALGVAAFIVDYRLAPEHKYPAPLEDVRAGYDWLVDSGINPAHIILAGDSAGAALATALALNLRDDAQPRPAAVIALSPYYDSEGRGDSFETNAATDVMAGARGRTGIQANVTMFIADETQRTSPYVSALRADVTGLPPHFLTVGSGEILVDGVRAFAQMLREADIPVEVIVAEGMQHVYPVMAGRAPEADEALRAIAAFINTHTSLTKAASSDAPS